jgi:DNA-binding NtrC family response regulator
MRPASTPLFTADDRVFLQAVVRLAYANPFSPARSEAERAALGALFIDSGALPADPENRRRIAARLCPLLAAAHARLTAGAASSCSTSPFAVDDLVLYQEACLYQLREGYAESLQPLVVGQVPPTAARDLYRPLVDDHGRLFTFPGSSLSPARVPSPEHLFEHAFQIRRAYHSFSTMIGTSRLMEELRAAGWDAIFTRDLRGHLRSCHTKRSEVSTLITGPSGTGKELVAGAIGRSLHKRYDVGLGQFVVAPGADYCAVNPAALSDSLFESELFGHERGAFTGALKDRKGIFETVSVGGALFLDEIGELALDRQPKLLRVLQERVFQRVGSLEEHPFSARVISATHQDLLELVAQGKFRLDLYQRLAGLRIVTPSLRAQLDVAPWDLGHLVRFCAERLADEEAAPALAAYALRYIEAHLPRYAWPGNVRELVHCVETLHHGGRFIPMKLEARREPARSSNRPAPLTVGPAPSTVAPVPSSLDMTRALREATLTEPEAGRRYRTMVVAKLGSIGAAARHLGLHRNTIARTIDHDLLARWKARQAAKSAAGRRGPGPASSRDHTRTPPPVAGSADAGAGIDEPVAGSAIPVAEIDEPVSG